MSVPPEVRGLHAAWLAAGAPGLEALPGWARALHERWSAPSPAPSRPLTPREATVLPRLLAGATTKQIARDLTLSPETIKDVLPRVYAKYGVATRVELIALFPAWRDAHG